MNRRRSAVRRRVRPTRELSRASPPTVWPRIRPRLAAGRRGQLAPELSQTAESICISKESTALCRSATRSASASTFAR